MTPLQKSYRTQAASIIKALEKRGMEGYYFDSSKEAVAEILSLIPDGSSVSWGGSATLEETGMLGALQSGRKEGTAAQSILCRLLFYEHECDHPRRRARQY